MQLPAGYRIEYGGEFANQQETQGPMVTALVVSLVLIFFILLFQFKNLKESAIVMLTIPLSLFGAILGLYLTHNNFSFTAFIGLIALSGIVVRNAIILVDHTNELMKHGMSIQQAAVESGKRRMRPIFLTAMAAAIGVLPMILSGSPMWAPLASVLAFGVVWSMLMALLTVPVLYVSWIKAKDKTEVIHNPKSKHTEANDILKAGALLLVFSIGSSGLFAQQTSMYTLQQLTDAALQNNHLLKIKSLQIREKEAKIKEDEVKKYPSASISSMYQYVPNLGSIVIPAGAINVTPLLPGKDESIDMGQHNQFFAGINLYQPISQQSKIKTGILLTKTDIKLNEVEKRKASLQISQAVEQLYFGILIAQKQKDAATYKLDLDKMQLKDVENALLSGKTITVNKIGLQANIADGEQNLLKLQIQIEDYLSDLKNLTGIKEDSFQLKEMDIEAVQIGSLENYISIANVSNPDVEVATLNKSKALLGIKAAKQSNLPDFGIIGGYTYQKLSTLFPTNNPSVGLSFKWNLQDLYSNKQVLAQRQFQVQQAEENIANTRDQVNDDVEKAYRKIRQSDVLVLVAKKAVAYRKESLKVQTDKQAAGLNVQTDIIEAKSLLSKSESDLYAAQLAYKMAVSNLKYLTGK
jgi:outer membrane protein TolC